MADALWNSVVLHWNSRGSIGGTDAVDNSVVDHTPTYVGGLTLTDVQRLFQRTTLGPFDGTDDRVNFPDSTSWNPDFASSGGYVIEARFRSGASVTGQFPLVSKWDAAGGQASWHIEVRNGQLRFLASTDGSTADVDLEAGTIAVSTDYEVAIQIETDGTVRMFVDGTQVGTSTISSAVFDGTSVLALGAYAVIPSGSYFNGHLYEVRITKGNTRYTSGGYTTQNHSWEGEVINVPGPASTGDPFWLDVPTFFPFDTTNQFNNLGSLGGVANGPQAIQTAVENNRGGAYRNPNGTGTVELETPVGTLPNVGEEDFTIEFWMRIEDIGTGSVGEQYVNFAEPPGGGSGIAADNYFQMDTRNNQLRVSLINTNGNGVIGSPPAPPPISLNTWHHFAFCVDKFGIGRLFIDGAVVRVGVSATRFSDYNFTGERCWFFKRIFDNNNHSRGTVSEFRITNRARYTEAFTPLAEPMAETTDDHRYWRVRSLANFGNGVVSAARVQLLDDSDTDIALLANSPGRVAIAGSEFGGFPAANAFDDADGTAWASSGGGGADPNAWVGIDLGAGNEKSVVGFSVKARTDNSPDQLFAQAILEWSNDGVVWNEQFTSIQVGGRDSNADPNLGDEFYFYSEGARPVGNTALHWRLLIEQRPASNAYTIAELEMFNPALQDIGQLGGFPGYGASSTGFGGTPDKLNDGITSGNSAWWASQSNAVTDDEFITHSVDPGNEIELVGYAITARDTDNLWDDQTPTHHRLQKSNGDNWTDVVVTIAAPAFGQGERQAYGAGPIGDPSRITTMALQAGLAASAVSDSRYTTLTAQVGARSNTVSDSRVSALVAQAGLSPSQSSDSRVSAVVAQAGAVKQQVGNQYYRIRSLAGKATGPVSVAEIEFFNELGENVSARFLRPLNSYISGSDDTVNLAEDAFDGANGTYWATDALVGHGHADAWVGVDFGSVVREDVVSFRVRARDDNAGAEEFPVQWILETSTDGIAWSTVFTTINTGGEVSGDPALVEADQEFTFTSHTFDPPTTEAAYWRILMTDNPGASTIFSGVRARFLINQTTFGDGAFLAQSANANGPSNLQAGVAVPWESLNTVEDAIIHVPPTKREYDGFYWQAKDAPIAANETPTAFKLQKSNGEDAWVDVIDTTTTAFLPNERKAFSTIPGFAFLLNVLFQSDFEGVDGQTNFSGMDDSFFNHVITPIGAASITDLSPQFGVTALDVRDAAEAIEVIRQGNEFHFLDGDFTIEFFIAMDSQNSAWHMGVFDPTGDNRQWGIQSSSGGSALRFFTSTDGINVTEPLGGAISNVFSSGSGGAMRHVAIVRAGSTLAAFVNGTRDEVNTNFTDTLFAAEANLVIGGISGTYSGESRMDAIRIIAGEAVYDPTATTLIVPIEYYPVQVIPTNPLSFNLPIINTQI